MEFWGVEVKAGEPLRVTPNPDTIIHLSQAALGETKKDKGSESVLLSVKIGDKTIVLGTLSVEKFPQLSFDVVFEKEFELSHNWKNGSVYLCGYQTLIQDDDNDIYDSEEEDELPLMNADNGKVEAKVENVKPGLVSAKPKTTIVEPSKVAKAEDDSDEDDDSEDDDGSDDDNESEGEDDSDEGTSDDEDDEDKDDEDEDEDKETPKKVESGKKRLNDAGTKTPMPSKKAKADTPQKTDGKKGVHTATPHPAKNAGKNPANSNKQTPKSGGQFPCKPCNRNFASDNALQSHNKAKHSGGK